jgi:hypothetical protein
LLGVDPARLDFELGRPRCDNRVVRVLRQAGVTVRDPALAVRVHHLHGALQRRGEARTSAEVHGDAEFLKLTLGSLSGRL